MKKGKYRKAVFVVTYAKTRKGIEYLLLKRKLHWRGWEFPKGAINFLEMKKKAVKRELKEETGLEPIKIKKFNYFGNYLYDKKLKDRPGIIGQTYHLFAVRVKKEDVKIDKIEHSDYKWFKFERAIKLLTWPNQKRCMEIVHRWLTKK